MQLQLNSEWQAILAKEIQKSYFGELLNSVDLEYQNHICYPPKEMIFAAFDYCSFSNTKVVVIGQDPYHGKGEANGLCFSVNDGVKIPPSLRNIHRELVDDLDSIFIPTSGNLASWANQGVLLLNAGLTVREDIPNSHKHLKWNVFTDAVIQKLSNEKEGLVFLIWGECGHPSPLSANQGKWFGNKHFSKTNAYLESKGVEPIQWLV
jgi:uracil-DNA glycosylase